MVTSEETCKFEVKRGTRSVSVSDKPLYFRILISRTTIDSSPLSLIQGRHTIWTGWQHDQCERGCNNKINEFERLHINALTARGDDGMVNLFKGYLAANDQEFMHYIKGKKRDHKEGRNISEDSLVWSGEWNAPTKDQKEILKLNAKLESLTKVKKVHKNERINDKKYEWENKVPKTSRQLRSTRKKIPLL